MMTPSHVGKFEAEQILRAAASGDYPEDGQILVRERDAWVFGDLTGVAGTVAWSSLTGVPTTLAGFGITDAASDAELNTHKTSADHDGRYYTEAEIDSLIATHVADTTSVHGITDTAQVVLLNAAQTHTGIKRFQPGGSNDTYATLTANGVEMSRHGTSGPVMRQNRSRGTEGVPTNVLNNDILGGFLAFAYDGSSYSSCAGIRMKADANHSTISRPTRVALEAVDQGSTTLREILIGYGNGHFGFATVNAAPAAPAAGYAFFYATAAGQIRARTSTGDHYICG